MLTRLRGICSSIHSSNSDSVGIWNRCKDQERASELERVQVEVEVEIEKWDEWTVISNRDTVVVRQAITLSLSSCFLLNVILISFSNLSSQSIFTFTHFVFFGLDVSVSSCCEDDDVAATF